MDIKVERHPTDPCARIMVSGSEEEKEAMELLFQGVMTRRHKEAGFTGPNSFTLFFQLDPELESI